MIPVRIMDWNIKQLLQMSGRQVKFNNILYSESSKYEYTRVYTSIYVRTYSVVCEHLKAL